MTTLENGIKFVYRTQHRGKVDNFWQEIFKEKVLTNEIIEIHGPYIEGVHIVFSKLMANICFPSHGLIPIKGKDSEVLCVSLRGHWLIPMLTNNFMLEFRKYIPDMEICNTHVTPTLNNIKLITPQDYHLNYKSAFQLINFIMKKPKLKMIAIDNIDVFQVPRHVFKRTTIQYLDKVNYLKKALMHHDILTVFTRNNFSTIPSESEVLKYVDIVLTVEKYGPKGMKIVYSEQCIQRIITFPDVNNITF